MAWRPGDPIICGDCGVAFRRNAAGLLAHPATRCPPPGKSPEPAPRSPRVRKPRPPRTPRLASPVDRNYSTVSGPRTLPMLLALADAPLGLTTPQLAELAGGASSWVNALGTARMLMLKQQARGRVEQAGTAAGNRTRESVLWCITDEGRRYLAESTATIPNRQSGA